MKGVIFDLKGEFAHFRKFYTNSSSLTYTVPPRTTLMGLIAAIMGEERDTYYEKYNSSYLHLAVQKNTPTRVLSQTVNYLKATSSGELSKPTAHTQIPFEILRGLEEKVSFRIYAASEDSDFIAALEKRLSGERYAYPPSMGVVFFQADIDFIAAADFLYCSEATPGESSVDLESIVPVSCIEQLIVDKNVLSREKMPRNFKEDRGVLEAVPYLVDEDGAPITVMLKDGFFEEQYSHKKILFM